jgi:adenylate cyclase
MESTPSAQKRSHVPSRRLLYALGLAAIFIVSFLSSQGYLLQQFELKSIDWRFHVRGERTPADDVALVLIDERSLGELGQWPWPRSTHARLIEALNHGGARVIVFDVLFAEKSDPAEDAALVAAVKQAGNVVLGAFAPGEGMLVEDAHTELLAGFALRPREVANRGRAASVATLRGPLDPLMRAVAGIGLAMAPPDRDGVLRHAFLAVHNDADGLLYPTLGLAGGKAALSLPDDDISIDFSRRMRLGDAATVSLDTRGRAMINFTGGRGTREHISYVDVLEGRLEQGAVHNKIVLVGIGAHGLYDVHPNPFSPDFLGPEFNADFIDNVLSDNFLTSASPGINMLLLVLIGLIVTYLSANLRSITAAGVSAVTIVVFIAAVTWAFTSADMVIGMIAPTTTALLAYTLITLRRLTSEEVSRARLRKYFASYAPPEVVEELDAGIMQEKMAGTQSEITVLFSDIRGFTSIGSTMEPPRLVRFLNLYFTAMVGVVFDYGGTVDKFIGDGLLVLYNALTEQPDHAKRAVFTALEMQKRVKLLNEEWADDGFPAIRIGVGIHTGDAVVGNIGPEMRMDYTAIGSTVSLAPRTEGLTKDFGVEVIITDHTLAQLDDLVEVKALGATEVRGIPEPVEMYQVLGFKSAEDSTESPRE